MARCYVAALLGGLAFLGLGGALHNTAGSNPTHRAPGGAPPPAPAPHRQPPPGLDPALPPLYTALLEDQVESYGLASPSRADQAEARSGGPGGVAEPRLWFDAQYDHAPQALKEDIGRALGVPCSSGFRGHFTALLDPSVPFVADHVALEAQLKIYTNQFCASCTTSLYYFSRMFQGLGSRYHSEMCGLDNALKLGIPFAVLDGDFLFASAATCPESNDLCYFQRTTACGRSFCSKSRDSRHQRCKHIGRGSAQNATCGPNGSCLCGSCGRTEDGHHETMWSKHSCDRFTAPTVPLSQPRSHMWWSSQLLFFLLQPTDRLNAVLRRDMQDPFFSGADVVNVHVRRGRLKEPEMARFFQLQEYVDIANKRFAAPPGGRAAQAQQGRQRFFLQTNDPSVPLEARQLAGQAWGWTRWNRTGMDLQIHNDPKKFNRRRRQGKFLQVDAEAWTVHSLRNLWFMQKSEHWICTFSSNWCRLALRLTYATYGRLKTVQSLDDWGFDPYRWYTNHYISELKDGTSPSR